MCGLPAVTGRCDPWYYMYIHSFQISSVYITGHTFTFSTYHSFVHVLVIVRLGVVLYHCPMASVGHYCQCLLFAYSFVFLQYFSRISISLDE